MQRHRLQGKLYCQRGKPVLPSLLHSLISGEVLAVSKRGPLIQITEFEFLISPNPSVSCLPSTTCLRNLSRRWAPGAPLGRGFCRRPRVPGSASRPCPAVAVPSARAPDPGKEASAEPQATRRPANRAAGLSPTKAAHAAPPPCGGLVSSHLCHSLYHPTNLKKLATYYYVRTAPTLLAEWSVSSHTC